MRPLARSYRRYQKTRLRPKFSRNLADDRSSDNRYEAKFSFVSSPRAGKTLPNSLHELIANLTVGGEPLLAVAFNGGRIHGRPIFHLDARGAGQFQRAMMRFRGERNNEI